MACYRTATDLHAEKSGSGAGGAGAAAGRVVSGAAAEVWPGAAIRVVAAPQVVYLLL